MEWVLVSEVGGRHARRQFDRLRDDLWLDMAGNFITDQAKIQERIRRPDYGHLIIDVTVDDPKAYTRAWEITLKMRIVVDAELVDEFCVENEKSSQRFIN